MGKTINIKGVLFDLSSPVVMGVLNVTPDSFYAQSRKQNELAIIERISQIISQGGVIVDIGAQSSNPQSPFLSSGVEIERLRFALDIINREFPDIILSVDTFYGDVARFCVEEYGVAIINDISGGQIDETMFNTVARLNVPYILMHMRGTPQTMGQYTHYENFIQDVFYYFSDKIADLHQRGVNDVIIDPGFGFSKTLDQNYELMANLRGFSTFGLPLLIGISRKSMIYKFLNSDASNSLNGTTVLNTYAIENGANILRVHDVREAVEAIRITKKIRDFEI